MTSIFHSVIMPFDTLLGEKKNPATPVKRQLQWTLTPFLCCSHLIAHVDSANAYLTSKNVILMMVEGAGFFR